MPNPGLTITANGFVTFTLNKIVSGEALVRYRIPFFTLFSESSSSSFYLSYSKHGGLTEIKPFQSSLCSFYSTEV